MNDELRTALRGAIVALVLLRRDASPDRWAAFNRAVAGFLAAGREPEESPLRIETVDGGRIAVAYDGLREVGTAEVVSVEDDPDFQGGWERTCDCDERSC